MLKAILASLSLASSTSIGIQEAQANDSMILTNNFIAENETKKADRPVICYEPPDYDNEPIAVDTGVERVEPIDTISRELFIERLKASSLWDKVSYSNHFERDFMMKELKSFLQTRSNSTKVTRIWYSIEKKDKNGHQLSKNDEFGIIEIINLVVDDRKKAEKILDRLYKQYLIKVKNNDVLSDGETLHTYVRYNGILFELWGINRTTHSIAECNLTMLSGLTIN